jgi:hypothetical protein
LLGLNSKRSDHRRAQKLHAEKVEQHGDKEFLQIYLIELQMGVRSVLVQNVERCQMTQP